MALLVFRHVCFDFLPVSQHEISPAFQESCFATAFDKEQGHCSFFWVEGRNYVWYSRWRECLPVWSASGQLQRLNKPLREVIVIPGERRIVPQFSQDITEPGPKVQQEYDYMDSTGLLFMLWANSLPKDEDVRCFYKYSTKTDFYQKPHNLTGSEFYHL